MSRNKGMTTNLDNSGNKDGKRSADAFSKLAEGRFGKERVECTGQRMNKYIYIYTYI